MKTQLTLLTLALVAILAACDVDATPTPAGPGATPTPSLAWLGALIAQHRREPVTNPPVSIIEHTYNGETV